MRPKSSSPFGRAEGSASLDRAPGAVRPGAGRARRRGPTAALAVAVSLLAVPASASAAGVGLGTAGGFSVLGGSAVTNTGPTTMPGDLGVTPGTAVSGFPPGTVGGTIRSNDAVAKQAASDTVLAYDDAAGRPSTATVSGDLGGRTLQAGVYTSATSLGLTGDLVLDGAGDPNAVFVFRTGSTLTTASASRVRLIGGAQACNVFWKVGSSATIGTASTFVGDVVALTSVTLTTTARIDGRALARNGAVTLDSNVFTNSPCTTPGGTPPPGTTATGGGTTGGTTGGGTTGGSGGTGGSGSSPTDGSPTTGTPPRASTDAPTTIRRTTVVVGASLRPGSGRIRYYWQYGTTKRYGRRTATGSLPAGATARRVRRTVRGLRGSSTYHYRVVVIGPDGTRTYGRDRVVRTAPVTPARLPRTTGAAGFAG